MFDKVLRDTLAVAPSIISTNTTLLMRDRYETLFRICNHEVNQRPLALVASYWSEDTYTDSALHEQIERFHFYEVYRHFGLSLTQFFDLPPYIARDVLELSAKKQKIKGDLTNDVLNELNKKVG